MTAIMVKPETIRALENEIENLRWDLEALEGERKFEEKGHKAADEALVEMWQQVPDDKRRLLMEANEYIEEMFWNG